MSYQKKHKEAERLTNEVLTLNGMKDQVVWEIAERLSKLKADGLYKFLYGTDDLKEPHRIAWKRFIREVGENGKHLNGNTVDFWVAIYDKWVVEFKYTKPEMKKFHSRKLHRAIPYVNKQNVGEILDQAKHLPFEDFLVWLKETYE